MRPNYKRNYRKLFVKNPRTYLLAKHVYNDPGSLTLLPETAPLSTISSVLRGLCETVLCRAKRCKTKTVLMALLLVVLGCGTTETVVCEAGPCYLVGDYTDEEARAVTDVTAAIVDAGYVEPGYAINFVHDPDASFKGTTWSQWRIPGHPPRNLEEGYTGYCAREWCMVFVRRYGEAEPFLYQLLVHELAHALGYDHGPEMRAAEQLIWEYLR